MCVETLSTGLVFVKIIDLRGHLPRFTPKTNVLPSISLEMPEMCVESLRTRAHFSRDDQFEGSQMPRFTPKNEHCFSKTSI